MLEAGAKVDRYELVCPVGEGGMAAVWVAKQRGAHGFEKLFALKAIHARFADDPAFRRMFLEEARIASAIQHPNVASVFDLGEADGLLYLVMEYVDGESVAALTRDEGGGVSTVPVHVALRIVEGACAGLDAAHRSTDERGALRGVIHRDISPYNLLVSASGEVKLIDFGIALAKGRLAKATQLGSLKGRLHYMAPEQALQRDLGPSADVFAIGATLYRMLGGRPPFDGGNEAATLHRLLTDVRPDPLPAAIPEDVRGIVDRALAHDPARRFPSAAAMREALAQALSRGDGPRGDAAAVATWVEERLSARARARRDALRAVGTSLGASLRSDGPPGPSPTPELATSTTPRTRPLPAPTLVESGPATQADPPRPAPTLLEPAGSEVRAATAPLLPPHASPHAPAPSPGAGTTPYAAPQRPPPPPAAPEAGEPPPPPLMDVHALVAARRGEPPPPPPRDEIRRDDAAPVGGDEAVRAIEERKRRLERAESAKRQEATAARAPRATKIAIAVVVVLAALVALGLATPGLVRARLVAVAKEAGVDLQIGSVGVRVGGLVLRDVEAKIPRIAGISLKAREIHAAGLTAREVQVLGATLTLEGAAENLVPELAIFFVENRARVAGTPGDPRRMTLVDARADWSGLVPGAKLSASGVTVDVVSRGPSAEEVNLGVTSFQIATPKTTLGPWAASYEQGAATTRARLVLDPPVPEGPSVLFVTGAAAPPRLTVRVPRSPLSRLGIRATELGLPADPTSEVEVEIEGTVTSAGRVQATGTATLHDARIAWLGRAPTPVRLDLVAGGPTGQPLDVAGTRVTVGPFVANVTGTLGAARGGAQLDAAWRTVPITCEKIVRAEARAMGPIAEVLQRLAQGTGAARVTGSASASGHVAYDTKTPDDATLTFTTRETCGLSLFGL